MKIVTVIGARPQFVKAAVISRAIGEKYRGRIEETIVHTGQHYDQNMSDIFFDELSIPKPKYNLEIGSGSHGRQTGEMLIEIEKVLLSDKPDLLMIYGDTNSTIAGALAASKLHIPVAHIEAGLRSFNMLMPEEQNRILSDHLSQYLFCPTDTAISNLVKEGIYNGKQIRTSANKPISVQKCGDVMFDAIIYYSSRISATPKILEQLGVLPNEYALATIHRAENTDDPNRLSEIFKAFSLIADRIVLSLHPRTKKFIAEYKMTIPSNVILTEPIGYLDMIALERDARVILTDSGGVQKEAFFVKTPCVTLRDETEWVETVESGWNVLPGIGIDAITTAYRNAIARDWSSVAQADYFGDGSSAQSILDEVLR